MDIVHTIGGDARRQDHHGIGQGKKHHFSARSGAIDKRREEDAGIDQESDPEADPRPLLARKVPPQFIDEEEASSRADNTITRIEWDSELILQGEEGDKECKEA